QEILKGHGTAMFDPFGVYSPEYLNVIDVVESLDFRNDFSLANKMISDRLVAEGATKQDGKWTFGGNPVVIKIFIRCDDTRRNSLGESVASTLENIGFTIDRICGDLTNAQVTVYGSDPQEFKWHIYTEGYAGTSVFVKYNPTVPSQMYAPWFGNMPGAQDPSFWQYENETLDEVTQRIFKFDFTSESERNELVRNAVTMGLQESVRIFVVQTSEPYAASSSVKGLVNDFGAGITSRFSLVNAAPDDSATLNIGVKQLSAGAWNGPGGFKDTFSRTIGDALGDPGMSRNPYTGDVIPVRVEWTDVETNGPTGKVDIHPDAQKWDPYSQQWKKVGDIAGNEGSKSKVTFKIQYSKWHNGIQMDRADLLYPYYFLFEWGIGNQTNDVTVDSEFTSQTEVFLPLLKGIRFLSDNEVESYIDVWHYDETEIADYITIWAGEPWEITAAEERLVSSGKLAYSRGEATSKQVDWLSTVSPAHANMIKAELQKMKDERFVPAALKEIVDPDDAARRYDASIAWISEHRNAEISNGPFYLDDFNPEAQTATIRAFRDESYPFEQGHWSVFGTPQIASVESVERPPIVIGQPRAIQVEITVAGQPSSDAQVSYFISGREGTVVKGQGKPLSDQPGKFLIDMNADETSKLSSGPNTLKVFATSNMAYRPDFRVTTILASAATTGTGGNGNDTNGNGPVDGGPPPSGCLIATAAFGSELTPQVQYLRHFRDDYILSTASGSAFMNVFNSAYYSFSPQVADYERQNPWLQLTVKISLYPLFGILTMSERVHTVAGGGEAGAILAGAAASILIGAVYLSIPAAVIATARPRGRKSILNSKTLTIALIVLGSVTAALAVGTAINGQFLLSITSAAFVLILAGLSAMIVVAGFSMLLGARRKRPGEF
ncbi:MAG: CFI-box-CTERM domain-containing protein, partial [Nitrososphaera sp.]